jgi:hypothetical protein
VVQPHDSYFDFVEGLNVPLETGRVSRGETNGSQIGIIKYVRRWVEEEVIWSKR